VELFRKLRTGTVKNHENLRPVWALLPRNVHLLSKTFATNCQTAQRVIPIHTVWKIQILVQANFSRLRRRAVKLLHVFDALYNIQSKVQYLQLPYQKSKERKCATIYSISYIYIYTRIWDLTYVDCESFRIFQITKNLHCTR